MALTHQILKYLKLLATQMQYYRVLANRYFFAGCEQGSIVLNYLFKMRNQFLRCFSKNFIRNSRPSDRDPAPCPRSGRAKNSNSFSALVSASTTL